MNKMTPEMQEKRFKSIPPNPNQKKQQAKNPLDAKMIESLTKAFDEMMEPPKSIKDKSGKEHTLPELLFDDEFDLIYKVKKLIGKLKDRTWETILDDILDLKDAKGQILGIASIIIGKDETFIRQNFSFSGLVGLLTPFLVKIVLGKNKKSLITLVLKLLSNFSKII